MAISIMAPEPPDKSNREEVKRIIREALVELNLRLSLALQTDEAITHLADEVLWAARRQSQLSLESPLHEKCVQWLKNYALAHLPTLAAQMSNAHVSYAPIPIGEDEEGKTHYLSYSDRPSGGFAIGLPGMGKTNLLETIINADIKNGHGVVVITSNDELPLHIIAQAPDAAVKKMVYFTFGLMDNPPGFNLIEPTQAGIEVDLSRATDFIDRNWGYGSVHPSTGPRMMNVIEMGLHVLYRHTLTMAELIHFLQNQAFRKRLCAALEDTGPDHYVKQFWADFETQEKRKQQEWVSPVQNKVYKLMRSRQMLLMLAQEKMTIPFRTFMDEGYTVIISIDKNLVGGMENVGLIGTALVGLFMRAAFSRKAGNPDNRYCSLFVDEFENFVSSEFEETIPQIRKYGVGILLANQVYAQLSKTLQAVVDGMVCQFTFACSIDDAQRRAHLHQREPETLYRDQQKRVQVQNPVTDVLSGKQIHSNPIVLAIFNESAGEFRASRQRSWEEEAQQKAEQLRELDSFYYSVMTGSNGKGNPYLSPPWYVCERHITTLTSQTPLKSSFAHEYWDFHTMQEEAALQEPENEDAQIELQRIRNRFAALFTSQTDAALIQALTAWEKEARAAIREELSCVCEEYLSKLAMGISLEYFDNPSWETGEQNYHMRCIRPEYIERKRKNFESALARLRLDQIEEALGFPCDVAFLKSRLTLDLLQWKWTYHKSHSTVTSRSNISGIPDKTDYTPPSDGFTLVPGQETLFLPFIEAQATRAVAEAKPVFEAAIRTLREVNQALATLPITQVSSETESVPFGTKSTIEMRGQMAQQIVDLPKYNCFVRLGHSDIAAKPLIHTRKPEPGVGKQELEERLKAIREQTKQYGTAPEVIEQELEARRVALGIAGAGTHGEKAAPGRPNKETGKEKENAPSGSVATNTQKAQGKSAALGAGTQSAIATTQHAVIITSPAPTPDDFLTLLYYLSNATLIQLTTLAGLIGQTKDEQQKINKREQSKINRLIGDGLVEKIAPEQTSFLKTGGRSPLVYRLSRKGYEKLHKEKGYKPINQGDFSLHAFKTNEVLIAVIRGMKETPSITLVDYEHEKMFRQSPIVLGDKGQGLEPDGWLCLKVNGQLMSIFLEIDRRNEGSSSLKDKLRRQVQAIEQKAHKGFTAEKIAIAFINPNGQPKDADRLVRIIEEEVTPEYRQYFLVASISIEDVTPLDLLTGPLFRKPGESAAYPLVQNG